MKQLAFRMQLKFGQADEYRRRHDQLWPELASEISAAGIYDYSIFLDEPTLMLFAVLKLRDDNTVDRLPNRPVMRRWWAYMADLMEVQPDDRPVEVPLTVMFHLA